MLQLSDCESGNRYSWFAVSVVAVGASFVPLAISVVSVAFSAVTVTVSILAVWR